MKKFLLLFIVFSNFLFSQEIPKPKSVTANRISESPTIDGVLDEDFWQNADMAKDFVMLRPGDGDKEREDMKTTIKIVYNDEAIFFGATMYDPDPSKIGMQYGGRDEFGNIDFFLISINPNNDGQNDTEFVVMSTGAQADAKISSGQEDFSWNAVWDSEAKINGDSWVVEMKIPYSALRFSNTEVQTWGVNFHRRINRLNEQYCWNYIDKKNNAFTQYSGLIEGIENISPPTRLSFSPYGSIAYSTYDGDKNFEKSIGMDVKYGISEGFTLDATLIPDFGQTDFDNVSLNLGPFEQYYSEKRSFFTEGTELFNMSNLFYSRRIGNEPTLYGDVEDSLADNEEVDDNPSSVNMLNAIKISGRTKGNLGIGVFNAITEKTEARIKSADINSTTGEEEISYRYMMTEPLANYNVLVLDQQFNKSSSITLMNTNVLREGDFRDANVTGLLYVLADKNNKYLVSGDLKMSNVKEYGETIKGFAGYLRFDKTYGNFQYKFGHWRATEDYDINDLGFQTRNNYSNYWGQISYRIFKPSKLFNNYRIAFEVFRRYRNSGEYVGQFFEFDSFFETKNRIHFGLDLETGIGSHYDFYEPNVEDRYFKQNSVLEAEAWISTDYRKVFAIDARLNYASRYDDITRYISMSISPRVRFSNKFTLIYELEYSKLSDDYAYVDHIDEGEIYFGNRNFKSITNSLSGKYSFSTKSSLSLSFRHYWAPVKYDSQFYELNENGLLDLSDYSEVHDINYNIWNLDIKYNWEFAPGSFLVALYRNSMFLNNELSDQNFGENLNNLFKEPVENVFSLKLIYYLDYNKLKSWF